MHKLLATWVCSSVFKDNFTFNSSMGHGSYRKTVTKDIAYYFKQKVTSYLISVISNFLARFVS